MSEPNDSPQTRLSLYVNTECMDTLRAYSEAHKVTLTEAVRRAVGALAWVDVQQAKSARVLVVDGAHTREVRWP